MPLCNTLRQREIQLDHTLLIGSQHRVKEGSFLKVRTQIHRSFCLFYVLFRCIFFRFCNSPSNCNIRTFLHRIFYHRIFYSISLILDHSCSCHHTDGFSKAKAKTKSISEHQRTVEFIELLSLHHILNQ